jgi:uncharacterized OsmC-like protein
MAIKMRHLEAALQGVEIDVEKIMAANPRRICRLNLTFSFPGHFDVTEAEKAQLEEIAMTCPVKESIHPGIALQVNFNWK